MTTPSAPLKVRPRIALVVEGHGEVHAVPRLLHRTLKHFNFDRHFEVVHDHGQGAVRAPGCGSIMAAHDPGAERGIEYWVNLAARVHRAHGVLVLVDADTHCPKTEGPALLKRAVAVRGDLCIGVVLASREYEAWILAGWTALRERGLLRASAKRVPQAMLEGLRDPKGKLCAMLEAGYSETKDQPVLTDHIPLTSAKSKVRSLRKWLDSVRDLCHCLRQRARGHSRDVKP